MTETAAQQHFRLPVDDSPPPERLRWPMLLAAAAGVLLLHLALVTVFTPLAPEQNEAGSRTEHSALYVSSRTMAASPEFLNTVDVYDPIAFLHPPAEVGFSFFRVTQDDFSLESPSEPVLPPRKFAELEPLPPFEPEPVARPLALQISPDIDMESGAELTAAEKTVICDIDFFRKQPAVNDMGRMWGSQRFMSPEEYTMGAALDEVTNVFTLGQMGFSLFTDSDTAPAAFPLNMDCYRVLLKAIDPDRNERYRSIAGFEKDWQNALQTKKKGEHI